eukprot:11921761-Karenia_brevis.AAC.1
MQRVFGWSTSCRRSRVLNVCGLPHVEQFGEAQDMFAGSSTCSKWHEDDESMPPQSQGEPIGASEVNAMNNLAREQIQHRSSHQEPKQSKRSAAQTLSDEEHLEIEDAAVRFAEDCENYCQVVATPHLKNIVRET